MTHQDDSPRGDIVWDAAHVAQLAQQHDPFRLQLHLQEDDLHLQGITRRLGAACLCW